MSQNDKKSHDDVGVYDCIKSVKRAKLRCSQSSLLLDNVLTGKMTSTAKISIRRDESNNYENLYKSLKTNLGTTASIELCCAKLESVWQNNDTIQVYNQRLIQYIENNTAQIMWIKVNDPIGECYIEMEWLIPDAIYKFEKEAVIVPVHNY